MKERINQTKFESNIKVCVMRGFYDEEGEYREEHMEDVTLGVLPEKAIEKVNLEYDITTLYSKRDVLVIARSIQNIDEYKKLEGNERFFHGLLHTADCDWYDGYMCRLADLEALRRLSRREKKNKSRTL